VARLNLIEGAVSFLPSGGNGDDWVTATLNRPLTTGDRLWADANSRSELHIGSTAIRMDGSTGISFLNLDSTTVQMRLSNGSIIVRLRQLDPENTFEVDTPNLAFAIRRPGNYRIDVRPDANETIITVRQGEGEVIGGGRSWQVISDQQAILTGADSLDYDLKDAEDQPLSDFDRWARSRDEREDRSAASRYVSREMTGYEDLDAYGTWRQIPGYGWCWVPAGVVVGWAPYRYGHWVWIAPWGWTWVDDAPWGFAPFHYGRWAYYGTGWVWVPGPVVVRPVYAPALVAWVGGRGFSFSVSFGTGGGVGWFPLGPREVFVPAYRVSESYVTNINVTNTVVTRETVVNVYSGRNVQSITYVNRSVPSAVTVVSHETFVNARPVDRNVVLVPERELTAAPVSRVVDVAPARASVFGTGSRGALHPPAMVMNLPVVTTHTPPAEPNHFGQVQGTPAQPAPSRTPERDVLPHRPNTGSDRPPQASPPLGQAPQVQAAPEAPNALAKPAPPVRTPTAKEQADVAAKHKAWENSHQKKQGNQDHKEHNEDRDRSTRQ
jgi:hypothetical protein